MRGWKGTRKQSPQCPPHTENLHRTDPSRRGSTREATTEHPFPRRSGFSFRGPSRRGSLRVRREATRMGSQHRYIRRSGLSSRGRGRRESPRVHSGAGRKGVATIPQARPKLPTRGVCFKRCFHIAMDPPLQSVLRLWSRTLLEGWLCVRGKHGLEYRVKREGP